MTGRKHEEKGKSSNFTTRPIVLGNNTVECVTTYKLLGIIISNDLKWGEHIDNISKKSFEAPVRFFKKFVSIEMEFS